MSSTDDFRFSAHRHLLDLEACTYQLMMLVASGDITGITWEDAMERQRRSFDSWLEFTEASIDPCEVVG